MYTPEEKAIVDYIEEEHPQSIDRVEEAKTRYATLAHEHTQRKKAISIRINESDLYLLKQRALTTGISYQNIIQTLIHQYTHGTIKPQL
jgi:predicted DNA binding CopG/RHH family protein